MLLAVVTPAAAQERGPDLGEDELAEFVLAQPSFSATPVGGSSHGPFWTTRNIEFAVEGCMVHWTRHFSFSVGTGGDPEEAVRFQSDFGGEKSFDVNLETVSTIERTASAPNTLSGVDYALGEIIFRGEGISSGGTLVDMSGLILGGEDVRAALLERLNRRRNACAGR